MHAPVDEKRTLRLETQTQHEQVAYRLHRFVREQKFFDITPAEYRLVEESPALRRLEESVRHALLRAAVKAPDRAGLFRLAASDAFFALPASVQRKLVASRRPIDDLVRLISGAFSSQPERVQRFLLSELDRAIAGHELFVVVVDHPGFGALSVEDRLALLSYCAGPRASRGSVAAAWGDRLASLARALRSAELSVASPRHGARLLRRLLFGPSSALHVMSARGSHHHDRVILGEPDDPSALSYGLRRTANEFSDRLYTFASPDPFVMNGWQFPPRATSETYRVQRHRISRHREMQLIGWIESNFPCAPRCSTRFTRPRCFTDGAFADLVRRFLDSLAESGAVEPEETFFSRGGVRADGPMNATQRLRAFLARRGAA